MNPLYNAVRKGNIRFILLVAPPRSVSTGIAIALSQSPDVDFYIHEPFSNDYSNIPSATSGAKLIGDIIKNHKLNYKKPGDKPATIIIKEISTNLRPFHFHYLSQYSMAIILMVRSPLLQLSSIASVCKWVWEGSPKNFTFNIRSLKKEDLEKYKENGDIETYFLNSWRYIGNQLRYLENEWPGNVYNSFNWIGIDTELVRYDPKNAMKNVSQCLGICFTDRMISEWRKEHIFNIKTDQWSKISAKSICLHKAKRSCPKIEEIPKAWYPMVEEVNCIYKKLLFNSNFLVPNILSSNCNEFNFDWKKIGSFIDVAPDTCYLMLCALSSNNNNIEKLSLEIRKRHPNYLNTFDVIDQAMKFNHRNSTHNKANQPTQKAARLISDVRCNREV